MKNHFLIPYAGNKRQEVEIIYENIKKEILNEDIKTIIEPFCGTSALSYYISTLHPKRFNYILNDNNKFLIELYKILKSEKKTKKFEKSVLKKITPYPTKEEYKKIINENTVEAFYIKNKFYCMYPGLYPDINNKRSNGIKKIIETQKIDIEKTPIINFLRTEKIKFKSEDAVNLIERRINKKDIYVFFDPPYMMSENSYYDNIKSNEYMNIYQWFFRNNKSILFKFCFAINKNWIMGLLFSDFNKKEYDVTYRGKKKNIHMIIKNN